MPAEGWRVGAAALPLAVLLVGLLGLHWRGTQAGIIALGVSAAVAAIAFAASPAVLGIALWRAIALSLHVLYIVWAALLLYEIADKIGAIRSIGTAVAHLTEDHVLQLLIVGFAFTSFLQGVAGFGVPVAVTAPLLIGLGFQPLEAAAVPLVGHAWAVTMGDMASSFQALRAVTGLPPRQMGIWIAALLGIASVATGFAVAHVNAGTRQYRRAFGDVLLLALSQQWIIASFGAGMVGLVVSMGLARLARRRGPGYLGLLPAWPPPQGRREPPRPAPPAGAEMSFHLAFLPYYALIGVVAVATFIGPLNRLLDAVAVSFHFGTAQTGLGWTTESGAFHIPVF